MRWASVAWRVAMHNFHVKWKRRAPAAISPSPPDGWIRPVGTAAEWPATAFHVYPRSSPRTRRSHRVFVGAVIVALTVGVGGFVALIVIGGRAGRFSVRLRNERGWSLDCVLFVGDKRLRMSSPWVGPSLIPESGDSVRLEGPTFGFQVSGWPEG
jgi:hypothetical protein